MNENKLLFIEIRSIFYFIIMLGILGLIIRSFMFILGGALQAGESFANKTMLILKISIAHFIVAYFMKKEKKYVWFLAIFFSVAMIYIGLNNFLIVKDEVMFIFYFSLLIAYSILFYMLLKKNIRNIFLGSTKECVN